MMLLGRLVSELAIAFTQWWAFRDMGFHVPLVACIGYMVIFGELGWRWLSRRNKSV